MVRALIRQLNDLKLRDKMLLSFLLFMVLPQVVLGVLVVQEFRHSTLKEALARAEEGVGRLQRQTIDVLAVSQKIGEWLAVDRTLETLLTTRYDSPLEVFRAYNGFNTFQLYRPVTPEVAGIQIYVDNPTILDNWEIRPLTAEVRRTFWFEAARKHPYENGWFSWRDETKGPSARLSLVRYLRYPAERNEALLVVDLDTTRIDSLLGREGFETLVLDPNLRVVASSRPDLGPGPLEDRRLLALIAGDSPGTFTREYAGQTSMVFAREIRPKSAFNGLKIFCIVSPSVILQSADRASTLGLTIILAGALVSLVFLWVVYTLFARRLETLSRQLPLVAAGDFARILPVDGTDEIGQLTAQFNTMVGDIRVLMDEVKTAHEAQSRLERAQGEIQLKMLSSQINPHFLFNVLESIRMKAHLRGEREISTTVKQLGRLMRKNLEASGKPIPLGEELENIRCYLEIEKFRLEEKLEYTIDADPGAIPVPVLPLIVEPLVENAVVHGLERRYGGGKVSVTARLAGEFLEIEVADDGLGMDQQRREGLFRQTEGKHVGLANVHQRLQLTYGPEFGLTVESAEGQGTSVRFRIPVSPGAS